MKETIDAVKIFIGVNTLNTKSRMPIMINPIPIELPRFLKIAFAHLT